MSNLEMIFTPDEREAIEEFFADRPENLAADDSARAVNSKAKTLERRKHSMKAAGYSKEAKRAIAMGKITPSDTAFETNKAAAKKIRRMTRTARSKNASYKKLKDSITTATALKEENE